MVKDYHSIKTKNIAIPPGDKSTRLPCAEGL